MVINQSKGRRERERENEEIEMEVQRPVPLINNSAGDAIITHHFLKMILVEKYVLPIEKCVLQWRKTVRTGSDWSHNI